MLLRWKVVMMILRNVVESGVGLSGIHEEEALRKQADGLKSDCFVYDSGPSNVDGTGVAI